MRNLYGMIALALFSAMSTRAVAAEPIECESPNFNSCHSFDLEELPRIDGYDMCQYRQMAGISTTFDGETYFVTIDPNAPGAAGVPLAFVPDHQGEWESWEQLNYAFEQLLVGTDCHGTPLPSFPSPNLCNPTGINFNFDFKGRVNWVDPSTLELIPDAPMDAFYGAFSDVNGRIRVQDIGVFEMAGDRQCADVEVANGNGETFGVQQCSSITEKQEDGHLVVLPCGPGGHNEYFPSLLEVPYAHNYFAYFELNGERDMYIGDGNYQDLEVDEAEMTSSWFYLANLFELPSTESETDTPRFGVDKRYSDGACGEGRVKQSGFGAILLKTSAGTGTCQ